MRSSNYAFSHYEFISLTPFTTSMLHALIPDQSVRDFGKQGGIETGFSPEISGFPVLGSFPPFLHTHSSFHSFVTVESLNNTLEIKQATLISVTS
jgi:hypothetical protein